MKQLLVIAEGDADLCDLYEMALTECGYDVITTSDGLDCLKRLRQATPAILVLNLELHWGGSDGVLAWLREVNPTHGVPVIMTGTEGRAQDLAHFIVSPVVACLPKSFTVAALLESVRDVVARSENRKSPGMNRVTVPSVL